MSDVDLIVAGAGAAGYVAAIAAADRGLSVLLAEASPTFRNGSNTSMSTSMIPAGGSRWQAANGIEDSPELFREDITRKTKGTAEPTVTCALTEVAPDLVAWLADEADVPLELVTEFRYPGHRRLRMHAVSDRAGRTLLRHLDQALQRRQTATLVVPLRLQDVVIEQGAVVGAVMATPDGAAEEVRSAGGVVLATNGFGANEELVARFVPEAAAARYHGGDESRGDALRIGERIGARLTHLDAFQGHGALAVPHGILLTWATVMHGAVLVNSEGRRFEDETLGYSEFGPLVLRQPGRVAWMIFDGRIDAACQVFADYQDLREAGAIRWADDVVALAKTIGCSAQALDATLAAADRAAASGEADEFGRAQFEQPLRPPFAAVKVTGALFHTQGGLAVDEHARVLTVDGAPIPGLFAAGGAAVGISGHGPSGYLAGNGLLSALGLGLLAGRHASRG
jgi:fumarate reductase flavoprotein subunit